MRLWISGEMDGHCIPTMCQVLFLYWGNNSEFNSEFNCLLEAVTMKTEVGNWNCRCFGQR